MTKEDLQELRYAQEYTNSRRKELNLLREQIEYIRGIDYTKDKTGDGQTTQEDLICNLLEQEKNLMKDIKALEERKDKAKLIIFKLDNISQQLVLYKRYILCETWEKIANSMSYTVRNIHIIHGRALLFIEKL